MASGPSHEAVLTSTGFERLFFKQGGQCESVVNAHIDSADPFRFLLGTECSPFFPYRWIYTGVRIIRTRDAYCRPEDGQSNRKNLNFVDGHVWERSKGFWSIYWAIRSTAEKFSDCLYNFRRPRA